MDKLIHESALTDSRAHNAAFQLVLESAPDPGLHAIAGHLLRYRYQIAILKSTFP